jgi:type I restriction enzyme M protein
MSYQQPSLISTALSQSELEHHQWEAANILRGPVDAADFKTSIFPLLFYKRIASRFRRYDQ